MAEEIRPMGFPVSIAGSVLACAIRRAGFRGSQMDVRCAASAESQMEISELACSRLRIERGQHDEWRKRQE
jgi:hypothetical protein